MVTLRAHTLLVLCWQLPNHFAPGGGSKEQLPRLWAGAAGAEMVLKRVCVTKAGAGSHPLLPVNKYTKASGWVSASVAAAMNSLDLSSAEIANRDIKIWKTRTVPFHKNKNPLNGVIFF